MSIPFHLGEEAWRVLDSSRFPVRVVKISPKSVSVLFDNDVVEEDVDMEGLEPRFNLVEGKICRSPAAKDDSELWTGSRALSLPRRRRGSQDTWSLSGKEPAPPREPLHFRPLAARCFVCSNLTPYRCEICGDSFYCSYLCRDKEQHVCIARPFRPLFTFPNPLADSAGVPRTLNFGLSHGPFSSISKSNSSSSSSSSKNPWGDGDTCSLCTNGSARGVRIEEPVAAVENFGLFGADLDDVDDYDDVPSLIGVELDLPHYSPPPPPPPYETSVGSPPRGGSTSDINDDELMAAYCSDLLKEDGDEDSYSSSSPVDLITDYGTDDISRALGETTPANWTFTPPNWGESSTHSPLPPPIPIPASKPYSSHGGHVGFYPSASSSSWPPTQTEAGASFGSDKDDDLQRAIMASLAL